MRPTKDNLVAYLTDVHADFTSSTPLTGRTRETVDEVASTILISTLLLFNCIRKNGLTRMEARTVMRAADGIIFEEVDKRKRKTHRSKGEWNAY